MASMMEMPKGMATLMEVKEKMMAISNDRDGEGADSDGPDDGDSKGDDGDK